MHQINLHTCVAVVFPPPPPLRANYLRKITKSAKQYFALFSSSPIATYFRNFSTKCKLVFITKFQISLEHYLFVEETLLKITVFFVPGSLLKVLKRKWTKTNHEFFMYRNLEFFWVFCTQNLYRVPAVGKCFGQILAMLLLSLHLYSSCFSAVSRFCRI